MPVCAAGLLGFVGGVVLLAAFLVPLEEGANTIRLLLFAAGLAAAGAGLWSVHAPADPRLAIVGSVPVIAATGTLAVWLLVAQGVARPFAGDFGLLGFWIAIAMWLAACLARDRGRAAWPRASPRIVAARSSAPFS